MQPLSTPELLKIWEQGASCSPIERYLLLLKAARPELSWDDLAQESLGQRNAYLLTLRAWIFGPELTSLVTCPACEERLEFSFNVSDIRPTPNGEVEPDFSLSINGHDIQYRLPTSYDLLSLPDTPDSRRELLQRCIVMATHNEQAIEVRQLPATVTEAVEQAMARLDPLADVQIGMTCPNCRNVWQASFEIGHFFWQEINAWALQILQEVHLLASAYGWREADILAMSGWKRQLYLKMIYG